MHSGFVDNGDVRLHYLASGDGGLPLLLAPGLSDRAEDYRDILTALRPRRAVAMSFRGQGRSSAPASGYDLPHHASDIHAIAEGLGLTRFALFGHSRAVAHAIAYAAAHEERVAALLLGDNAAVHRAFPPEWVDAFAASQWRGQPVSERISTDVLAGIQREAENVDLWETLASLSVPRCAVLGGDRPTDALRAAAERYRQAGAEVVILERAGHALWVPDLESFVDVLRRFADTTS